MGPGETRYARLAVAPIFPSNAAVAAFGLSIDRVRIVVVRPVADTLADTTVSLPPDADVLDLNLRVPIVTSPESVLVSIIALSGTIQLFEGTAPVEVSAGVVTQPTEIPVTNYVGPGAGVDSLAITPRTPFIYFGDSLRFQIQAFQGGTAVPQFYVSWTTSDTALAHINGTGTLRAPAARTNVRVIARTPGGAADSITATFQPVPNQLVLVAGGGQSGLVGQPLALPLTVEVRAADNFPVAGTAVRFRAPAGGSPADTTIIADSLGHATVNAVLGSAIGAQTYQITLPGFPSVSLNVGATATSGAISPATSIISVSSGSVQSGNPVTLTLQGKDGGGNNMTAGGATVVFSVTGGTSTGTIAPSPATDNGNGTYTASFTGVLAGTATTVHATIDGAPVATALPTVAVTPGTISPVMSLVSVSAASIGSGGTATLTLQAKDAAGNNLTTGGATVAFTVSGGTSAGTIGPITDHANGTYTAVFTATVAGSAATIGATIAAVPVSSTLPTITVNAGAASAATSVLSASTDSIASGAALVLRVQAKDAAGNNLTSGGATVVFTHSGGTSTGTIGATADSGNGVYTATFTGVLAGTATTIAATLNGGAVANGAPTIAVKPGPISTATSVITASTDTLLSGAIATLKLRAKDAAGNLLTGGGATVVFTASGGASTGAISATADSGTGVYTATFTGQAAGSATTINATINGGAVTSALPALVVKPGAPAQLAFTVQPSAAFAGTAIAPAVQVTARDAFGNTTPAFTGSVTVAIGTNPGGGVLSGTLSRPAVAGVATFNDLQIDQPGTGYTLTAAASGLTTGTSAAFDLLVPAGTIAWINSAGGNWSNPANWNGGVVPGPTDIALITLPGTYTVTFDVNDTIGGVQLGGSSGTQTLSLASKTLGLAAGSQINVNGVLTVQSSTINGSGSITNAGKLIVRASTVGPGIVNQATLQAEGGTALNGPLSTTAASALRLQGNGVFSTANLTIANGFTNNGTITLTDTTSSYGAVLHVTSGTLTNAPGALIQSLVGTNGTRNLDAQLDNQGTIDVSHPLSFTKAGAANSNSGTINVHARLTIQQTGASPSFTNTGTIALDAGDTVVVTGGLFAYSGGSISGGTLTIGSATVNASQSFTTATAALALTSVTWGGSGTLTIASSTTLNIAASTMNSAVNNQGTFTVRGGTSFNAGFTNASGATLRLQGDGTYSTANVTFATGFTNNGTIVLTDTTSSYGAVLNVTSGTLTNAAGASIVSAVGTLGTRSINAQLDNQGTITINRALTLNKAAAAHVNSGTIDVLGGTFTILQGGASPSFTQSGAINIATGNTVAVSAGTFNYASGTISGPGAITFTSGTLTLTQNLATATVPYSLTSMTVGGTGTLTVDPSTQLQVKASTINSPLANQGQLDLHGGTNINGTFTNASGATLRLQGDGTYSTANVTFANSFTNNGAIVLTDTTSSYGAILNLPTGQRLTNAPGGTIVAAVGTAGPRTLGTELDNQGTITLNRPMTLTESGAQHVNSGTIDISGGDLTLSQSGTTPSFTTSGTITIGAGRTFQVNSGTLNYNAGSISGSGVLAISSATVATTQDFSTATTALTLTSATWGGIGKLTVAAGTFLNVKASTINSRLVNLGNLDAHGGTAFNDSVTNASGATLRVQGDGTYSTGNLTVANGFTNGGTIVLTDTTSSYGAVLHVTNGTFVNAAGATVRADSGTRGPKTLDAQLDNEGSVAIAWPLTLSKASAAHVNRGTISANAKFTISLSGTTPSFRQVGTLAIGTGDTVTVNAGTFVYDSGTISGGVLALSGTTVQAAHDFSTASTALKATSVTWNGAGTLTVAPSTSLVLQASTINSALVNQGDITTNGLTTLNGAVTNAAGATLRVQGNGIYSTGTLVLANGLTNSGAIVLTDTTSSYGAVLTMNSGTLVNAPGATIRADTGTNGSRTFNATLDNQGTFISAVPAGVTTTINKASAAQQNSGTWTVASGTVTIQGAGATFTNATGGTVQGAGVLKVSGVPFTNNGNINPGTAGTGILKVVGNYSQAATGALNVQLGGTTVGTQYDRLVDSAGTVSLNGALNVSLVNGFTPALGDTFTVLTFPSRSGTIPTLTGLVIGGGVQLDTIWSATSLKLTAIALATTHATNITASETWNAINSPHIVSGYLKVVNGATLTIEDGATVKFDAGAGLQIGDTALGQAGSLVMLGTPGSIHLTANTGTPAAGFWKGLEVQKAGAPLAWRNVDIEYAGATRPNLIDEACILLVDPAASVELDSVHIRQCIHAGVNQLAGNLHVHRSEVDTATGAGIASFAGTLRLDSTAVRGSGQIGLVIGNGTVDLAGAVANKFIGNAAGSVQLFGRQLPGFGRQDSIAGNGFGGGGVGDTILVDIDSGAVGTAVPAFTIFRQPAPYLVTGFLSVWSPTGVNVSLDTGLVMAFDTAAAFSVGDFTDSSGASSGVSGNLVSLGTAAQPVVLRNRQGRPGWEGMFLGAQTGTPVLRHMRLVKGGYQPNLGQICQNCIVKTTGLPEILNATLWVDAPNGTAPFDIDSVTSDSSHYHGIVVKRAPPQGVRIRDNTIRGAAVTGLVMRERYNAQDVISGNTITGNHNAVDVMADELPPFDAGLNNLAGNVTDTLLLHGGTLAVSDTLPQLGFRWRVTQRVVVDSGATFTVLAGDTVVFDDLASLTIGGGAPSAFHAAGNAGAPILFTVTPGGDHWLGLDFANLGGAPSIVSNLIVEKAGGSTPCFGDCLPILFGAIRYSNVSTSGLTLDAITVRQSRFMALDVKSTAASPVLVQNSQFYENPASPMITSPNPLLLSIHGSDLYHYNGQIIQTANAGADSIDALGNWWGDLGGLERGFQASDSAGMGTLSFNAVKFDAVVPGPHFPVGPAAQLVPATDTVLANGAAMNAIVGDPDSIRVRVLDAQSRGVGGVTIGWGTSSGTFNHPGTPTDAGGRAAGVWQTTNVANLQFVQATVAGLIGSPVTFTAFIQPGLTVAHDFQLDPALTQGSVSADHKTVTFSSSNHHGVLVTHAVDGFGNVTHPTTNPDFCFDDVPSSGFCHNQFWYAPQYGIIDSVKADSVFFTVTTTSPALFQIHARYDGTTGAVFDSVFISMNAVAAGVRIIDPLFNTNADTAVYNSLCPVGGPYNALCRRTFMAQLVDSGGAALPPSAAYQFSWTNPLGGPTISDSSYGTMNEFGVITAHQNGSASMIVQQIAGPPLSPNRDTLAITVNQVVANIAVTPDTISAGLGDTVTFSATGTDQGGSPMAGAVGWRQDTPAGQGLTIIDYPTANSIRVRLDSTSQSYPRDVAVITAFTERAPSDTVFAGGVIYNPIILATGGLGAFPQGSAVDPVLNQAYVVNTSSNNVSVIDGSTDKVIRSIDVGPSPASVAVNPATGMVYVSNSANGTVSVIDGKSFGVVATIPVGLTTGGIAVDTIRGRVYVGSVLRVAEGDIPFLSTIDGATNTVVPSDSVRFSGGGGSAPGAVAVNPLTDRAFVVLRTDTVAFVDVSALTIKAKFGAVGFALSGVTVNTQTNRVYVGGGSQISVIDATPGVDTVFTGVFIGANSAQGMSVNEKRDKIYAADASNNIIHEIDGATNTYRIVIIGQFNDFPQSAAVNPVTGKVYVPHASALTILKYFSK